MTERRVTKPTFAGPHGLTPNRPGLDRRGFLQVAGMSLGGVALGSVSVSGQALPYDGTLRDRLWMWGHDSGSLVEGYGIGAKGKDIEPAAALEFMGIPNICMVRFTGTPLPPFDDYVRQFNATKRLTWSIVDGATNYSNDQKRQQALELAGTQRNLVGLDLDDFFIGDAVPAVPGGEARAHHSLAELQRIREELVIDRGRLDLNLVLYSQQLHPAIAAHLDLVDSVYFWTWRARDLSNLEANFAAYRQIAASKPTLLGIYMWDFGEKKTIPIELMEHQCRLGLDWLKRGEIEGLIFHCTPLCGMDLEAVAWSKAWIARHANVLIAD